MGKILKDITGMSVKQAIKKLEKYKQQLKDMKAFILFHPNRYKYVKDQDFAKED
ncbi:MAG: hypothetical protein ACFFG0_20765 [Candidatus Thorarchaeota archaeon]